MTKPISDKAQLEAIDKGAGIVHDIIHQPNLIQIIIICGLIYLIGIGLHNKKFHK